MVTSHFFAPVDSWLANWHYDCEGVVRANRAWRIAMLGELGVYLAFGTMLVIAVQFISGWLVLGRKPWRVLTGHLRRR